MNILGYIKDHADRSWCTKVESAAWWEAAWKEAKAIARMHGDSPKVGISSQCERITIRFDRRIK